VKFLFDQNLSPRLVRLVADIYPACVHVSDIGMDTAPDTQVWAYAAHNGFTIASKDADFHQRSLVFGHPPKVVWIRLGNCSVSETASLLRNRSILIHRFEEDPHAAFLALTRS
jgi:predicted nuclease of predicted toxin-antitoxin system